LLSDANNFIKGNHFFVTDINGDLKDDLLVRGGSGTFIVYQSTQNSLKPTGASYLILATPTAGKQEIDSWSWM